VAQEIGYMCSERPRKLNGLREDVSDKKCAMKDNLIMEFT
jgi:hypothetical protein